MAQKVLSDILTQCGLGDVSIIKITGGLDETIVQTFDQDKTLFIAGKLKEPLSDFNGEFGISELKLLKGLLGFTTYQADDAMLRVVTRKVGEDAIPTGLEFKGKGSKSMFNLMNAEHVPTQPKITTIPWDITTQLSSSKAGEIQKFSSLFSSIDSNCAISTVEGDLVATFGKPNSSVNSGSLTLQEDVDGSLTGELMVPIDKLVMLIKLAMSANSHKLMFSSSAGLLGLEVETEFGVYNYYLRQNVRPE